MRVRIAFLYYSSVLQGICVLIVYSTDFSLGGATTITIGAGSMIPTSGCVSVSATDDTIVEGDEDFDIVVTMTDQTAVVVGASDTTTVTIPANDGMSFL